jgi:hypothetical protein
MSRVFLHACKCGNTGVMEGKTWEGVERKKREGSEGKVNLL